MAISVTMLASPSFTPGTEVDLCGHATLASAFVILSIVQPDLDAVTFLSRSGPLTVRKIEDQYEMVFPAQAWKEIPVTDTMTRAFGARPARNGFGVRF